jgi:hypothetical protein
MSHAPDSTAHPRAEDDHVNSRLVVLVGVGALLIFTAAALLAMAYLKHERGLRPAPVLPAELGQTKIGLVEQSLFFDGNVLRGDKDRADRRARLDGLGWVDRAAGVAHIPIADAMTLAAAGVRPAASTPPSAPPLGAAHGGVDAPSVPVAPPRPQPAVSPKAPAGRLAPAAAPKAPAGQGGAR